MRRRQSWVTTLCFALILGGWTLGCSNSPTSPGRNRLPLGQPPPQGPPPPPASRTLTVVSGWDQTPVPSAQVRLEAASFTTDANGRFESPGTVPPEAALDVDAPGFLPRRTRLGEVAATNQITLWPAANEAEAAAIQAMAFYRSVTLMWAGSDWPVYQLALMVEDVPRTPSEILNDWVREYAEIRTLTGRVLSLSPIPRGNGPTDEFDNEIIVKFDETEQCKEPWGFCDFVGNDIRFGYFSRPYRMSLTMAQRPGVIKRLLAFGLLNANPLPGLLNKTAPATELSLLEKQTLKMQAIRPSGTRWPDTSRSR